MYSTERERDPGQMNRSRTRMEYKMSLASSSEKWGAIPSKVRHTTAEDLNNIKVSPETIIIIYRWTKG